MTNESIDPDDIACEEAQAELEKTCYYCGKPADPVLRVAAGMGWCGCAPNPDAA